MDSFLGEIRILPFPFAPANWAWCNGQLMAISQNTALFSILGTQFGGDGRVTFGLPNLPGRVPVGAGQGPGLSDRTVGEEGGSSSVTLTVAEIPPHTHALLASPGPGNKPAGAGNSLARTTGATPYLPPAGASTLPMNPQAITAGAAGGGQPHNNMQPYLGVNFNICLNGIFPPRS